MNKPKPKQKTDIYDVNKYSTKELYGILDLNNPTDRELEAKIIFYINKYDNVNPSLYKFFNDIYGHFFEVDDEDQEIQQDYDAKHQQDGFTNMFSGQATNSVEGFDVSFNGLDSSYETDLFVSSETAVYDTPYTNTNPRPKPGSTDVSFNVGTQDLDTKGSTSIGYTTNFNFPKGNLNPLLKETIKRIISIDSQYRDISTFPLSTFFTFNLSDTLTDVVSLKLYSIQIPYTWYTINNNYGSNFFYIKGVSPGINDGNSDYKFTIDAGTYTAPGLITAINDEITSQTSSLIEVDLSNTDITYNQINTKCTFNINIVKRYNDSNYELYFPTWTNPGNTLENDPSSRFNSIPGFLGLLNDTNATYTIYSKPSTIDPNDITQTILLNNNNNYLTLIFYTDLSGNTPYNSSSTLPIPSIIIPLLIPLTNSVPTNSVYSISSILTFINTGFDNIPKLKGSSIIHDNYTINNINTDQSTNSITYYRYKINIKLNRQELRFYDGMKAVLQFPNDTTLWLTPTSTFNFDSSTNELSEIISEIDTPVTSFVVTNNPYIYLKCNSEYYGYIPIDTSNIDISSVDICGNPILPPGSPNHSYKNTNLQPNTINIIPNNLKNYYIGLGTYTITGDSSTIINKTVNITRGNINISGNNYTIYGQNYNVNGNARINGNVTVLPQLTSTSIGTIDTTSSGIYNISGQSFLITESIVNGNINIQGNTTILGNVSIVNIDPSGLIINSSNYSIIGNTQIQGNITIMNGLTQLLGNNSIDGSNYYISGNSFINGTTYIGNVNIISGNAIVNNSSPYTIYNQTPQLIITGNTNVIGNISLIGNANLYNLNNASISGLLNTNIEIITPDSSISTTGPLYICSGNIEIKNILITSTYTIQNTNNYFISGQDTINDIPNSIFVNGNAQIFSGNVQMTSINSYIISDGQASGHKLNGNINITGNITIQNANIQINSISSPYTISGQHGQSYQIIGNTYNITGNTQIQIKGNIQSNTPYSIQGNSYYIHDNAQINGNINIRGNVNIDSSSNSYIINGNNYSIQTSTKLIGNIIVNSGNLFVASASTPYIIKGNDYSTAYISGDYPIIQGNTYIINGNSTIHGNAYSVYGNISVRQDISLNDYRIDISNSVIYLLPDYLNSIQTSMDNCIANTNLANSGSSITIDTNNTTHHSSLKFNIKNNIPLYDVLHTSNYNYSIDLVGSYLNTVMKLPLTINGNESPARNTSVFNVQTQNYQIDQLNNKIIIRSCGLQNKNVPAITLSIDVKPGGYSNLNDLVTAINKLFISDINHGINMTGTNIQCIINANNTISTTFTLNISSLIEENLYSVYLYDNYLISNQYSNVDISGFYGPITKNWLVDISTNINTWKTYLDIPNQNYNLFTIPNSVTYLSYGEVSGNGTIQSKNITLIDASTNYFYIRPIYDPSGGVYTTEPNSNGTAGYNDILITIPANTYSKELFTTYINSAFNANPITQGSRLSFIIDSNTGKQYTKLRLNISKNFTTKDFILDFYDPVSFTTCNVGLSGKSSIQNVQWDETLGWILGFRNVTNYYLKPDNQIVNITTGKTYYIQFPSTPYSYDYLGNAKITGDTSVSVFLYNYFMIILDDYVQNHLNDGLVTITNTDFNIPLPSYANRATFICDPITHKPVVITNTTRYNSLTQKQIYAANEILNVQQTNQTHYSSGPFTQDIFGLVPIKVSGMQNGQPYIEFGGSLQLQERTYFGPVNIRRMTIKLVNDKGAIVDLNGANWSFSLVCEQLYSSTSKK